MSRKHQGQSNTYQRKMQVRDQRTFDRLMFRIAKFFHDKREQQESSKWENIQATSFDDKKEILDRAFIRRLKSKIRNLLAQDHGIDENSFVSYTEDDIFELVLQNPPSLVAY